jgi:serine/threonine-protein kinase RsbW
VSPGHDTVVQLDIPADHRWLSIVSACVAELLGSVEGIHDRDRTVYGLQLAVHEACTNIIDHAYGGPCEGRIAIALSLCSGRELIVELRDTGEAFDMDATPMPDLDKPQVHGYGLFLIRSLVDSVTYTPLPSGNTWRLARQL